MTALSCGAALLATTFTVPAAVGTEPVPDLVRYADEDVRVLEVVVADSTELDRLVSTGADLDHAVHPNDDGTLTAHVVAGPSEVAALRARGFDIERTVHDEGDTAAVLAEREATLDAARAENEAFSAAAESASVADVKVIRADYYTSFGQGFLSVEAKFADGQTSPAQLRVDRDSGPGTEIGSGGNQNISRFVDAGVYLYHRGAGQVATRPDKIRVTSPSGDSVVVTVNDWLPLEGDDVYGGNYETDFITSYLTPTELYDRVHALQAEFPGISEIVELPNKTNGYRRLAQAVLGTGSSSRVAIDSKAWGHEGGNDVTVALTNPGVANSPLTVSVTGSAIAVSLATGAAGELTSTAAEVVAAVNANPGASALVTAYTYRNNAGAGVVAAASAALTDDLSAPDSVSRDPHPVYALRIGKHRDGSRTGVLAYAQEHAREWVPPLVSIEAAERLLRNYQHDGRTKQLVDNLDIWIVPSVNPDGGHYSFYDFNSQRKNMTNHCERTGSADFLARNSWGVDNNRNYDEYSLFDGYNGASSSCTSGTFAGPAELSEPESANIDWIAANNDNIKYSMNLHSSGNYFMWAPGAYITPGRISAPRPSVEDEAYFWGASSRILTEIKRYRGMSVTHARTGPISDVLYSAAGNSGDMLWYKYGIYAWNFEVGTQFQPPFSNENPSGASAHAESQEFANGLIELFRVAYDFDKDKTRPSSSVVTTASATAGMVDVTFTTSEAASVFYTTDRSVPTFDSTLYASAGIREGGETVTVPQGTTIHWFSVDAAGNVEKNYRPDGSGKNYNKTVVR
ncbi:M14 family metallopeptidase [Ornithinimicrobium cerasi]|uniref:Chitobiase/beta-hexosaminidase C-terminal domain-containing protein n=1 Tax=Ornithinimicrobium cerasi TaxID=2248773 RepID=A0A285VIA6_9MICO|nr:M14 family metallopeptidase [Ornithinimicrobium cerasi]SOC52281.1 Chitobiase/beta-hexosaminidase C-terminal domain-containing protein [Ornithinimicrobium cerasi]